MLLARLEGGDTAFFQSKLRILGYLTLHTRQLDMIMDDDNAQVRYRHKIETDITAMLAPTPPAEAGGVGKARLS